MCISYTTNVLSLFLNISQITDQPLKLIRFEKLEAIIKLTSKPELKGKKKLIHQMKITRTNK